ESEENTVLFPSPFPGLCFLSEFLNFKKYPSCIESVLGKADYNHNKVNQWTAAIVEQSLTHLVKLGKTYKYIVTCAVMQRSGAGLHTASSCFWDTTTDGTCTVRWENRTMNCIVNVFAVAIIL
uniref:Dynein light chain Tctex-type 3 n=1 Tax=Corvus moneduloides TaxID=1196302 RepID=A0A8U7MP27_CORMO